MPFSCHVTCMSPHVLHEGKTRQAYLIAILPNLRAASYLLGFKAACDSQFGSLAWSPPSHYTTAAFRFRYVIFVYRGCRASEVPTCPFGLKNPAPPSESRLPCCHRSPHP